MPAMPAIPASASLTYAPLFAGLRPLWRAQHSEIGVALLAFRGGLRLERHARASAAFASSTSHSAPPDSVKGCSLLGGFAQFAPDELAVSKDRTSTDPTSVQRLERLARPSHVPPGAVE